jgi:TatD DNase family protein
VILVDSHAHVTSKKFDADRDLVLERARAAGVVALVEVGCDLAESERAARFARDHASGGLLVWASVGVHPHEAKLWDEKTADALRALSREPRVVAIGETGLDYFYDHSPRDVQRTVFEAQLALADELDRPAVLHVRDAHPEALEILRARRSPRLRGVAHCFSGDAKTALAYVDAGFSIAVGGLATFKTAAEVLGAAVAVPIERLLLETDCPFMAPVPHRGKRCEPAFVSATCAAVAKARGIDAAELARVTTANTVKLFGLELPPPRTGGG